MAISRISAQPIPVTPAGTTQRELNSAAKALRQQIAGVGPHHDPERDPEIWAYAAEVEVERLDDGQMGVVVYFDQTDREIDADYAREVVQDFIAEKFPMMDAQRVDAFVRPFVE